MKNRVDFYNKGNDMWVKVTVRPSDRNPQKMRELELIVEDTHARLVLDGKLVGRIALEEEIIDAELLVTYFTEGEIT